MKKRYIALPAVLLLFIGVGFIIYKSLGSLDSAIQQAVEKYGSEILQTDVRLRQVNLDITEGKAALSGLHVGNPKGYKTDYAMKVESLRVNLDLDSITSSPVLIKEVLIEAPDLIYEKIDGVSNFDALLNNIDAYTGGGSSEKQEDDSGAKLVIENLRINDGKVGVSYKIMQGKTMTVPLPDIHLKDIGKDKGGASPGEVAKQVMGKMTSSIGSALGGIKDGAGKVLEKGKEGAKKVGDKLKGLFD